MPRPTIAAAILSAAIATLLAAPPAAAQSLDARFDISFRGITGGQIALSATESDGAYVVLAQGRPTGLASALVDYRYDGTARGTVRDGRYTVGTYEERELDGGEETNATIAFDDGRPTAVTFDPPRAPEPWDIDPTAQSGVIDSLSALYQLVKPTPREGACDKRYDLFDGRHVSRLTLDAPEPGDGGTIACSGEYLRIAGYDPEEMANSARVPMTVIYGPAEAGLLQVVEIRAASRLGDAVLRRQ